MDMGFNNIIAEYTGWTRGSFLNDPLWNLRVNSAVGGTAGMNRLVNFANQNDAINLFPAVNLMKVASTRGINGNRDLARYLNNQRAVYPEFNMVTRMFNPVFSLISPHSFRNYTQRITNNLLNLNIRNISIMDAGTLFYGDLRLNDQIQRFEALYVYIDSMRDMSDRLDHLMFRNANSYMFRYASYIVELPMRHSGRELVDYAVPFVQMILENVVQTSLEPFNDAAMLDFNIYLLRAVESKSGLRFNFTYEDERAFSTATRFYYQFNFFRTQFSRWEDEIFEMYSRFNYFWGHVWDATMYNHEILPGDVRRVTYDNGVVVLINYSREYREVDGVTVGPEDFVILNGVN